MPKLEDAIKKLRQHNSDREPASGQSAEQAEEIEFQKLQDAQREEEERRCPSLKYIPRFYHRKAAPAEESNPHDENSRPPLRPRVLREARAYLLNRKTNEELLDEDDLHLIMKLLKEYSRERFADGVYCDVDVIDYEGFASIRDELLKRGERFRQFFVPSTFLKFPRDPYGRIAIGPFFMYLVKKVNLRQTRVQLSYYDALGCGYLRERDMENFIFELIPTLPQLSSLQEEFYPFYVFTAVRKFFFFLDPKRTGRLHIRDLLTSNILPELYELRQEQPLGANEAENNWFSMTSALRVYGAYLELDVDQNGMLNKKELSRFGSGVLTDVFIDRVFEEYQTYLDSETGEREMDYKTFLDFVLAMENKNSKQAIQYFWKLIDIQQQGWLDGFTINYFFRAILSLLQRKKVVDVASVDDVKDEIFDMVQAKEANKITFHDLVTCRQGGTVLSLLIDAAAFWRYDNRESLMLEPDDEDLGL